MSAELVHLEVAGGTATVTLDSPANRNALSRQLRGELRERLDTALADDAVRVVVLTHTGPVFCSGMDLKEARGGDPAQQGAQEFPALLEALWTAPKPSVVRLAGPARAGGLGLVAACDIAVAVDSASFAFTEVRLGVVPAVISVPVLPRLLARAAHELFLTGEVFGAPRAVEIGLLNSCVPLGKLDAEVARFTRMLALGGPQALAATKRLLTAATADSFGPALAAASELSARHFASEEGQEGIAALLDKRPARWVPAQDPDSRPGADVIRDPPRGGDA